MRNTMESVFSDLNHLDFMINGQVLVQISLNWLISWLVKWL